ncbi:tetratricopeptide repeat protein [Pedobacter sp. UBA5917]|jgi:TPR repeat protein|uniref:tetratricopeptide repeat protein n=1 Tax=Pedobacter sp. UBA5917 TaxID=1947061 RepID=UPI0025CCF107|nr:tetratricopeptide repeat protein [Pedobacter sp. UBA5917]
MKGNKLFLLAVSLGQKIYEYPTTLSDFDRKELYSRYFSLIKRSAYLGNPDAMYELGQQYENTSYLNNNNPKKSFYWYSKACAGGHFEACNNLAFLYETGRGCAIDLDNALSLYRKSSQLGSISGKKNYKVMLKDMSNGGKYSK